MLRSASLTRRRRLRPWPERVRDRHRLSQAPEDNPRGGTMRFKDRVALITAAASGIGRATADIIGAEGGVVVAVDTDKARLDATVEALKSAGGRAHGRQADALDPDQVGGVVEE